MRALSLFSQSDSELTQNEKSYLLVKKIIISGNKVTRDHIIIRELTIKENDTLWFRDIAKRFQSCKENLLNTSLFNFVTIDTIEVKNHEANISINVAERWYIWPTPFFEVTERNFNTWLETKNFSKAAYGIYVSDENFRGRKESLRLLIRMGYNEQYGFSYKIPYLNKKKTWGFGLTGSYGQTHETPYITLGNKPVFFKDTEHYIQKNYFSNIQAVNRKGIYTTQIYQINYDYYHFDDTLVNLNSEFSKKADTINQFLSLYYLYKSDHRDNVAYPLQGYYFGVELVKRGLGLLKNENINFAYATFTFRKFWKLSDRFHFASSLKTKISTAGFQPYFLQKGLGYGSDFLRGYEYYVADGQHFALLKTNVKFTLLPVKIIKFNFIPAEKFNKIHLAMYLNVYSDIGYVSDHQISKLNNNLSNTALYSTGVGLDFVTYYDKVFRFEYSVNRIGEEGFFLHFSSPI